MERVVRGVVWHRILDGGTSETAWLIETATGFAIEGTVAGAHQNEALDVSYRVECDAEWRSRSVRVRQRHAGAERSLMLVLHPDGGWSVDDVVRDDLSECTDIDLGITPSTNALPINRLRLMVDEEHEIVAAWIRFPQLDVVASRQGYARLGPLMYRYDGLETGFTAKLQVDRFGLPAEYEGIWSRIAEWPRSDQPAT